MLTEIRKLRAVRAIGSARRGCSATWLRRCWPGGGPGRRWSRRRTCATIPSRLRLTLLAALLHGPGAGDHRHAGGVADLDGAPDRRPRGPEGDRGAGERVQAGDRQGEHLVRDRRGLAGRPDDAVREVVFPAVSGGEQTLRELVHEFKTKGPVYRRTVQTTLKASYSNHYRRGLIELLEVLEFRSNNATHRPVLDALELITRHSRRPGSPTTRPVRRVPGPQGACWVTGRPWCSTTAGKGGGGWSGAVYEIVHVPGAARAAALQGDLGRRRRQVAQPGRGPARTTSRPTAPRTTPPCASRWTRPRSSTSCAGEMRAELAALDDRAAESWPGWRSPTAARRARSS